MWHVDEVAQAVNGVVFRIEHENFSGISTDSRTIANRELFIPISGVTFDGHKFIADAYDRSHGGTLCEKGRDDVLKTAQGTIILVDDTLKALLDIAHYKRRQIQGTFITITGSNGKTTTKEILAAIIGRERKVHFNKKNYNNLIGVSKSILAIEGSPDYLIFELGTNNRGEIRQLTQVTEPDISLITNINPSHLEGLDDLGGVLEEKLDLFRYTKGGGHILINVDDPSLFPSYRDDEGHVSHTFGMDHDADFQLIINEDLGWNGYDFTIKFHDDFIRVKTNLLGRHNLLNILSASSIAFLVGISKEQIKRTLLEKKSFTRMNLIQRMPSPSNLPMEEKRKAHVLLLKPRMPGKVV